MTGFDKEGPVWYTFIDKVTQEDYGNDGRTHEVKGCWLL